MDAQLLEGKKIAVEIQEQIKRSITQARNALVSKFEPPFLKIIQVVHSPSSDWYIRAQEKLASSLGIQTKKKSWVQPPNQTELLEEIKEANTSEAHGIFLTMPFPAGYSTEQILETLDYHKDVEGVHPTNLGLIVLRRTKLIPPTAYAAFTLIKSTGTQLWGKKAVVIGQSAIVGRPILMLLGEERVTTTLCNTGTSEEDLKKFVSESDIVIACAGKPNLIKGDWIRNGTVVIDVGTTEVNGKLAGDVEFEPALRKASFITPVPGGVGPLTVTMLMQNLINAYKWQKGIS